MWTDLAVSVWEYRWFTFGAGFILLSLGVAGIVMHRYGTLGPDPVLPPVVYVDHPLAVEPTYRHRRLDDDTTVIGRIPPYLPALGPVCGTCGGPWHAPCPSAPKADDCPLTTHELVIPTVGETPVHRAIADREPTQELSKTMAKIMEAQR